MQLSMQILLRELQHDVSWHSILPETTLSIKSYEFYDPNIGFANDQVVFICESNELPEGRSIPGGSNIICIGEGKAISQIKEYKHLSLLVCNKLSYKQLINKIATAFNKYRDLSENISLAIERLKSLNTIIDLGAQLIARPLCMLDMNHNVLAISTTVVPEGDKLWGYMEKGYGSKFREIVENSVPALTDVADAKNGCVEVENNISKKYVYIQALYRKAIPIAVIGMHSTDSPTKPFDTASKQLFHYFVGQITQRMELFSDIKIGRGKKLEQFLGELFVGSTDINEKLIQQKAKELGIDYQSDYLLGIVYSENNIPNDQLFVIAEYIEVMLHRANCIPLDSKIYVILSINDDFINWASYRKKFASFLATYNCKWVIGSPFKPLSQLSSVKIQMDEALEIVQENHIELAECHYYELIEQHAINQLLAKYPYSTLRHPVLRVLELYDKANDSDLLETFKVFLQNNCNVTETARLLFLHRNSLQYRINRIREIIGGEFVRGDFEDWEVRKSLLFSYECIDCWKES